MVLNKDCQEFKGIAIEQIQKLRAEDRVPISVSRLMQNMMESNPEDVREYFSKHNTIYTGDAIIYHPEEKLKIVLDSIHLREITLESKLRGGRALVLKENDYNSLEGEEFNKKDLRKMRGESWKIRVKDNTFWKIFARDQALLNDCVDYIFEEYKKKKGDCGIMGVFPDFFDFNCIKLLPVCLDQLYNGWFNLEGRTHLHDNYSFFLGIKK